MVQPPNNYPRFVSKATARFLPLNLPSWKKKNPSILKQKLKKNVFLVPQIHSYIGYPNSITKLTNVWQYKLQ